MTNQYNRPGLELPWHSDHMGASTKCIYTSGGWYVADVWGDNDAEFIVRACNKHAELVAEIERLKAENDQLRKEHANGSAVEPTEKPDFTVRRAAAWMYIQTLTQDMSLREALRQTFEHEFNKSSEKSEVNLNCPTCNFLYTGRGGQDGHPPMLSCPNGHQWPDPRGGKLGPV